ncbi:MAG: hypothetical protein HY674_05025 [Chloroflexi bacterium]|nr:hypothetical protein [Chloroflexota bacterium]
MKNKPVRSVLWTTLTTLALGTLLAALAVAPGARAKTTASPRLSDQLFAKQIAGAYLVEVPALEIQVLLQVSADGGTVRVSSADEGLNGGAPFASRGAALGNWKRTGDREIQLVEMGFEFDSNGLPLPVGESGKALVDLEFTEDWLSFDGTLKGLFYAPGADVLLSEPASVMDAGSVHGRRVR